jgi:acyl carrier protein
MKRKDTIVDAINAVLGTDYEADKIEGNMLLVDDLLFDSISLIQLVVELEDRFDVSMDELEDFSVFETVDSVCDYVDQLSAE